MEKFWHKLSSFTLHRNRGEAVVYPENTKKPASSLSPETAIWLKEILCFLPSSTEPYTTALTHRSMINDHDMTVVSNQRLEFLGDAVLDLVISEELYTSFPDSDEGKLSSNRAKIVNRKSLAGFARSISLGNHLLIGESADENRIRLSESSLADAFEALIGAIYIDRDLEEAKKFIRRHVVTHIDLKKIDDIEHNYKSRLIEFTQSQNMDPPLYNVVSEEGAEHEKRFTVEVSCDGKICGNGTAGRKKDAEQIAAKEALGLFETRA